MIAYASRTGTRRNLAALRCADWRLLVSAAGCLRSEGFPYALDNGAWSAFTQGRPFDVPAFERALRKMGAAADWTVLPDIVAGGPASLELSLRWMRRVLDESPRALLAVQNGLEPEDVRPFLGPRVGLFVGGDTAWKLSTLPAWCELARDKFRIALARMESAQARISDPLDKKALDDFESACREARTAFEALTAAARKAT